MTAHIDFSDLKKFAAKLHAEAPGLEKDLQVGLAEGGEVLAAAVKRNANAFPGKNRTSRIADSVRVRRRGVRVRVEAGGDAAPEAAPIERHSLGGKFRHPVFGHRDMPWASQSAHDFMANSSEETAPEVDAFVTALVDATLARLVI